MEGNSIFKIICGEDIKVQDLKIDNDSYIVFCYDKKIIITWSQLLIILYMIKTLIV